MKGDISDAIGTVIGFGFAVGFCLTLMAFPAVLGVAAALIALPVIALMWTAEGVYYVARGMWRWCCGKADR